MATTKLNFFNNTDKTTSNQILIFLEPIDPQETYLFSAWNVLNPSIGSTQTATLSNDFSGSIATFGDNRGNYSRPVTLELGKALKITNPNNQSPVIGLPGDPIFREQVGLQNEAKTPKTSLSVTWYVNGNKVVETNNTKETTLNPGFKSLFQLKQSVFLYLGQRPTETETYTIQTINQAQEFKVPNDATEMNFEVYTDPDGVDKFRLVRPNTYHQMVEEAVRISNIYNAEIQALEAQISTMNVNYSFTATLIFGGLTLASWAFGNRALIAGAANLVINSFSDFDSATRTFKVVGTSILACATAMEAIVKAVKDNAPPNLPNAQGDDYESFDSRDVKYELLLCNR
jgi:hypothetical protein